MKLGRYNTFNESRKSTIFPEDVLRSFKRSRNIYIRDNNIIDIGSMILHSDDVIPKTIKTEFGNEYDYKFGEIDTLEIIGDIDLPKFNKCNMLIIKKGTLSDLKKFSECNIHTLNLINCDGLVNIDYVPPLIKYLLINGSDTLKSIKVPDTLNHLNLSNDKNLEYIDSSNNNLTITAANTSLRRLPEQYEHIDYTNTPIQNLIKFIKSRGIDENDKDIYDRIIEFEVIKGDIIDYISLESLCNFYNVSIFNIPGWKLKNTK